ncbi:MAG: hypothetical protein SFU21_09945 [Flavihumibacter sp.]|nr:hypothetical protein [Flavihumibacter sp.]
MNTVWIFSEEEREIIFEVAVIINNATIEHFFETDYDAALQRKRAQQDKHAANPIEVKVKVKPHII